MGSELGAEGPPHLDDFVEAFEVVQARDGYANLAEFLPAPGQAARLIVLRELVRVDLEYGWTRGQPLALRDYLDLFPELRTDQATLQQIAFEEYRLRRQSGEHLSPEEYRRDFSINVSSWPVLESAAAAAEGVAGTVVAGAPTPHFQAPASQDSWGDSGPEVEQRQFLQELRARDPEAAHLLSQAVAALPDVESTFLGFRLIAELGRGAFGRVYLAQQGDLANRLVALKISIDVASESQTLAQLQHTNIVPVYSVHKAGLFQAVCMPYFGATTLADVLKRFQHQGGIPAFGRDLVAAIRDRSRRFSGQQDGPVAPPEVATEAVAVPAGPSGVPADEDAALPVKTLSRLSYIDAVLWLAARLADGLHHAHERGILHRDLKPANILLTDEGQPMLVDFNLSADTKSGRGASAAHVGGTLPFMSPEHLEAFRQGSAPSRADSAPGGWATPRADTPPVDARSDLYSLGLILYELLTGHFPFDARTGPLQQVLLRAIAERRGPAPRLCHLNRAVTPAVESIVRHLLEPDPARRYQSARQLQTDLRRQLASQPLRHAPEASPRERVQKWFRRHPRLTSPASIGPLLLLLIGALSVLSFWWSFQEIRGTNDRMRQSNYLMQQTLEEQQLKSELADAHVERLKHEAKDAFRQFQGALGSLRQREEAVSGAVSLLEEGPLGTYQAEEDILHCRAVLDRYHVLDDDAWQQASEFLNLPDDGREQLLKDVGELLYLLARSTMLDCTGAAESARRTEYLRHAFPGATRFPDPFDAANAVVNSRLSWALRLNELARGCYPDGLIPRSLAIQRAVLASLRGEEPGDLYASAKKIEPQTARDAYLTAYEYAALGRFDEALPYANTARRLDSKNLGNWFLLGICNAKRSDAATAIRCFDTCLALKADWPAAHFNRGLANLELENWQQADADFSKVLARSKGLAEPHIQRAYARQCLGRYAEALADLNDALEVRPTWTFLYYSRGQLRHVMQDTAGEDSDYSEVLRRKPGNAQDWTLRAKVVALRGDPEEALTCLAEALALDPHYRQALVEQAAVLGDGLSRHQEAVAVLDETIRLDPAATAVRMSRALLLAGLGRRDAAVEDAEYCLAHDPRPSGEYRAACVFALTAAQHPRDKVRALSLLASALRNGYGYGPGQSKLESDPRLAALHDEPNFRRLVLAARTLAPMAP